MYQPVETQEVALGQETWPNCNKETLVPDPGMVCSFHDVPFHRSASGAFIADPTASQMPLGVHETLSRPVLPLFDGFGVNC
jgi:hypothetical protein